MRQLLRQGLHLCHQGVLLALQLALLLLITFLQPCHSIVQLTGHIRAAFAQLFILLQQLAVLFVQRLLTFTYLIETPDKRAQGVFRCVALNTQRLQLLLRQRPRNLRLLC